MTAAIEANFNTELWQLVDKVYYKELIEDSKLLAKLRANGVDNWIGYEDSLEDEPAPWEYDLDVDRSS